MRIGDNSSSNVLLQDEEIDALLDDYGNKWAAGAACARSVSAGFARQVGKSIGKLKIFMAEASNHFTDLGKLLDNEGSQHSGAGFVGGISISDKQTAADDSDWRGASFSVGQGENPSGDNQRSG